MDSIRELLELVRLQGLAKGHLRGLLHIVIGRKVTKADGTVVSSGLTWREVAALMKLLRFDKDLVIELGADPESLAPRDRQRFWYSAIALAKVDSAEAFIEAQRLAEKLKERGYIVGPPPTSPSRISAADAANETAQKQSEEPAKKRKKK